MVTKTGAATLMAGLSLVLLASPAASDTYVGPGPSVCTATAAFSRGSVSLHLNLAPDGAVAAGSTAAYRPAGVLDALSIAAVSPLGADRGASPVAVLTATATVLRIHAQGRFVLTVGGQEFRSSAPGVAFTGDPRLNGKAQVRQDFALSGPLRDALAAGGAGRLAYLDAGAVLAQTDLSFAPAAVIQGVIDKTYPTALAIAGDKGRC
jgi:hypothetical protein